MPFTPPGDAELLDLIGAFYDATIEPARWPDALARLNAMFDGDHVVIASNNPRANSIGFHAAHNASDDFIRAMSENAARNPMNAIIPFLEVGQPSSVYAHLHYEQVRGTRWFDATVGRFGFGDVVFILLARTAESFATVNILRRIDQPFFGAPEICTLGVLAPHIRRAVMIANMLDARALQRDRLAATLDRLAVGVLLLDAVGSIMHANASAQRQLEAASALRVVDGRLAAATPEAGAALEEAIARAGSGTTVEAPQTGIALAIPAVSGGRDLDAWLLPLDGGLRGELGEAHAAKVAVFVREVGDTSPFPAELFVRRYGITPAELRVLMAIVQGLSPSDAAIEIGISLATTKTHLARLFDKTGTRGQPDLIRLAMSALAPTAGA